MTSPLINRLIDELDYPKITEANHSEFVNDTKTSVLFFAGNPERFPESLDVAIVLPELLASFSQLKAGVVLEEDEAPLKRRYAFSIYPALVFVREGVVLGSICKVQDWQEYLIQINTLLQANAHISQVIPTVNSEVSSHGRG
ncbi:MAG: hypothetical protein ABNH21_09965 [Glaciecola sp.]|jgi:hydrogenase-1 operon protein HyaE